MKSSKLEHKARNFRENGQGFLEYSVIIVLVVIILISFVALFGVDLFNQFIGNRARASEEHSTQASPEPVIYLYESGTQVESLETETIRVHNCPGGEPYHPEVERLQFLEYDIELDGELSASLRPQSINAVQTYYGFTAGTRIERTFHLKLEAPTDTMVDYTVEWQRVWKEGDLRISPADGSQQSVTYRAGADLDYEITNIEQNLCDPTPTP